MDTKSDWERCCHKMKAGLRKTTENMWLEERRKGRRKEREVRKDPRAREHRSPVMQDFHMQWGPGDHMNLIWEDSWDPFSLGLMWNSLSLPPHTWVPGMLCHKHLLNYLPPGGSVPSSCLSSNQTSLFYFRLLSELLQRSCWSWGRRREPLAAPGEERGCWVRWCWTECPGNIPSDFLMMLYQIWDEASDILIACISVE